MSQNSVRGGQIFILGRRGFNSKTVLGGKNDTRLRFSLTITVFPGQYNFTNNSYSYFIHLLSMLVNLTVDSVMKKKKTCISVIYPQRKKRNANGNILVLLNFDSSDL
jgi:hypothetical protein